MVALFSKNLDLDAKKFEINQHLYAAMCATKTKQLVHHS